MRFYSSRYICVPNANFCLSDSLRLVIPLQVPSDYIFRTNHTGRYRILNLVSLFHILIEWRISLRTVKVLKYLFMCWYRQKTVWTDSSLWPRDDCHMDWIYYAVAAAPRESTHSKHHHISHSCWHPRQCLERCMPLTETQCCVSARKAVEAQVVSCPPGLIQDTRVLQVQRNGPGLQTSLPSVTHSHAAFSSTAVTWKQHTVPLWRTDRRLVNWLIIRRVLVLWPSHEASIHNKDSHTS